jgi:branched-chain amino acid transport system ATP-binding protein
MTGPMTGDTPALAVRGMSVAYGDMVAVHDATFGIAAGEACAITGPNGNGKSSMLMGIAGLVRRRGGVEIFGVPAPNGDVRWAARHGLTLVPERRQLYPGLVRRGQHRPRLLLLDVQPPQGTHLTPVRPRS